MALTIAFNSKTSTSITFDLAGRDTVTYNQVEFQYCTRSDFNFALAPFADFATATPITLSNLNQGNTYFVRARERASATGAVGPWTAAIPVYLALANVWDTTPLSIMLRPAIVVVPEEVTWGSFGTYAGYPADNLGTDAPNEQHWLSGASGIKIDTAGQPIDTIAILGTNFPASATWTIRSYAVLADRDAQNASYASTFTATFQASSNLPGRRAYHGLAQLPAARTERYWSIVWSALPPGGVAPMMFGIAGLARTAKNIAADKVEAPLDYGGLERTRDGIPDRRYGWRGRRVDFEIALMTEAQWETQFSDLRYKVGLTDPVLVVPNTRTGSFLHDRILFGPISAQRGQQPYTPRFTQGFTIDSLI